MCTQINFRKCRKRLWAFNLNAVSRFRKFSLLCSFVCLLSFSLFPLFSIHLKVSSNCFIFPCSMTNRKYIFNWLYYLLWNFSTCICPVGMEKVSTELITKAFFSTTLTNMRPLQKMQKDASCTQFYYYYYGVILSSSFSGNSQPYLSSNPAA